MLSRLILASLLLMPAAALAEKPAGKGKAVVYKVGDKEYEGFLTSSTGKNQPLVVILHDWDGLTDYEKERAEMLRKQGYRVFAADLFGKGVRPTKLEDKQQHTGELYKDRAQMRRLIAGAVEAAKANGAKTDHIAVIGYCFGGAAALEYMRSGAKVAAFASIHGGLTTPEGQDYKNAQGRLLVQHGAADTHVSLDDYNKLLRELEASGADYETAVYGGAPHAWTVFGQDSYRERADAASWHQLVDFLKLSF